jgi:hypothetical protein
MMRTLIFKGLPMAMVAALLVACPPAENGGDNGENGSNGGNGENGAADAGPAGVNEGATCTTSASSAQGNCKDGLICVPSTANPVNGVCARDCGVIENDVLSEDPAVCDQATTTCQTLVDANLEGAIGAACLPPQSQRDQDCRGLFDEDACTDGMECIPTDLEQDEAGNISVLSQNCKAVCEFGLADSDNQCLGDEQCFPDAFGFVDFQLTDPEDPESTVSCTEETVDADCDTASGFECIEFGDGSFSCAKREGRCGNGISMIKAEDLQNQDVLNDKICNSVDAHDYCDNSLFEGLGEGAGESFCITGVVSANANEGFCFGFCSSPTYDENNNGTIDDDEQGESFTCPADYECKLDLGRETLIAVGVDDVNGPFGIKECNPDNCTEGLPCEAECGPGETECISFNSTQGEVSLCMAPFGNCEPIVEPVDTDGGMPAEDAGTPETDAGSTGGTDGGSTGGTDSGTGGGADSGSTGGSTDGGTVDAG